MQDSGEHNKLFLRRLLAGNPGQLVLDGARSPHTATALSRYSSAVASISLAIGARLLLDPILGDQYPFALVFLSILATAWYGGFRPALLSVVLGALASDYFLLPPRHSLQLQGSLEQFGLALYVVTAMGISVFGGALHSGRRRAQFHAALVEQLVEQTYDPVLVWEWDHPIVFWNSAAERLYGFSSEEAIGRVSHELLQTVTSGGVEKFVATLSVGDSWEGELQHKAKDGRTVIVESRMRLVRDEGRTFVLEGNRDITERKKAEMALIAANETLVARTAQLTKSEEILRVSEEKSRQLIAAFDKAQALVQKLDGTVVFWNSAAETLYGWSKEEAVGRRIEDLLHPTFSQPLDEIHAELLKTGSWKGEIMQHRRDGSTIWVASAWALHRGAQGEPASVIKVNTDITDLKRTSEALRVSEATVRSLFENASQAILTVDPNGTVVDSNAMVEQMFGYTHSELIGSSIDRLLPEHLRARHRQHRASYEKNPHARAMGQGMDLVAKRKDGSELPVEISLSHVQEPGGGGLSVAFISDITARKAASQERELLIAKLEEGLSEKTVLLKEVHHRVKNNLAVIAGLLNMQAESLNDERVTVALAESQQRVMSMALVHEYLYSNEHLDRVSFGKYVEQLTHELYSSYTIESERVSIRIEVEDIDLPVHRAIPCGLILNELLSNALKYAFPNGRKGEILVCFGLQASNELILSCEDNGIGIPQEIDWQNLKSMGLKIVDILSKQLDGVVSLDRSKGGTRFELRLPAPKAFAQKA